MAATAGAAYAVEVGEIQIVLSGGLPASPGASYLIGQKCTAQVVCAFAPPLSITSRTWSVSGGDPFKEFHVDHHQPVCLSSGHRINLSAADWAAPTLVCHFAQPGPVTVSCQVHLSVPQGAKPEGGLDVSLSKSTVAEPPIITEITYELGVVVLGQSGAWAGVQSPDEPFGEGFRWYAAVKTPDGENGYVMGGDKGLWLWVQIIQLGRTRVVNGVTQTEMVGSDEVGWHSLGLDTSYPFEPLELDPPAWSANGTKQKASDPPGETLESIASTYHFRDDFNTFLMYKPPRDDSQYVPLRKLTWYWGADATKNQSGAWVLSNQAHSASTSGSIPPHPDWSHLIVPWGPWNQWR